MKNGSSEPFFMPDEERRNRNNSVQSNKTHDAYTGKIITNCTEISAYRRSSSVTKIGSEEPILATASPRGKRLGAAAPV